MPSPAMNGFDAAEVPLCQTHILPIDASKLGNFQTNTNHDSFLDDWKIQLNENEEGVQSLRLAADQLRTSDIPVAFPTETVYGLGADATRSAAVRGIYTAKRRPADNPLIVHFASLRQLRDLLGADNPIPPIYHPLIQKFWPGPLTILLPNPPSSPLAPEVTAGLPTFGARIPRNLLALLLIQLSEKPIAGPSANASTKPSPTAAEHVKEDLDGRISYIVDGGPCDVGVESTVVDGLSDPPAVLRPGGVSIEQLRQCPGWEGVVVGYEDVSMKKGQPRAPGMKYRHYSPKAKVFLYDAGAECPARGEMKAQGFRSVGFIQTRKWKGREVAVNGSNGVNGRADNGSTSNGVSFINSIIPVARPDVKLVTTEGQSTTAWEVELGDSAADVARDLFWALRELDRKGCDVICVEGISDDEGDVAAAVMNRLRKAAELQIER